MLLLGKSYFISKEKGKLIIIIIIIRYHRSFIDASKDYLLEYLSIENNNDELYKTVLLIDEPEVHLHPPAQISLLNELIKITSNDRNNLLFFATHSNYLIDKTNLDRYFKVFKHNNEYTKIKKIEKKNSTYSEVNYEVSLKYTVP